MKLYDVVYWNGVRWTLPNSAFGLSKRDAKALVREYQRKGRKAQILTAKESRLTDDNQEEIFDEDDTRND